MARLGVSYRTMSDDDLPFVAALFATTRDREIAAFGWPAETQAAFLDQQHRAQHSHYSAHYADAEWLIVERGGQAIGRLYLNEEAERFHIVDISLLPECRGQGIGAAMLEDLIEHAGKAAKSVSINVERNNPARSLYQRLGFQLIADQGVYLLMERRP